MSSGENLTQFLDVSESWIGRLVIMLLGYLSVFIPGYLIIRYIKQSKYVDRAGTGPFARIVLSCVYGHAYDKIVEDTVPSSSKHVSSDKTSLQKCIDLFICFTGLQTSYLIWGILQEKIMTKEYLDSSGHAGYFKDSQFLVFVNRIFAFLVAATYISLVHTPRHTAPVYKYSYSSLSNIMSSWCQYEALKYVSFPTQVLAKASKIIPTMIMGKIVSGRKYEYYEYLTAVLISLGMVMFLLGSSENKGSTATTFSGVIILLGYMTFDSFTSNWQGELFSVYKMSAVQMMCGVNFFSCLLTSVSLLQQGAFVTSFRFMMTYPNFLWDCILLSACSTSGQLFIFRTISLFGPVVFVIIMTIRQGFAILLSCILYSHPVSLMGIVGILTVFFAVFLRIYCNYRLKDIRRRKPDSEVSRV